MLQCTSSPVRQIPLDTHHPVVVVATAALLLLYSFPTCSIYIMIQQEEACAPSTSAIIMIHVLLKGLLLAAA